MLVILALAFGALAVVAARSSAPDDAKPKLSASRIFKLLDHKSTVDWESNKGNKLVSSIEISITCGYYLRWNKLKCSLVQENVHGETSVCKVNFSFSTSSDIKVFQELSISVKPGQMLALVSPSGCAKAQWCPSLRGFVTHRMET